MKEESGLTLIELLLALALLCLAAAAISGIYYSGVRAWQGSIERMDCQQNARVAVDFIDRELRFADWVMVPQESGSEIRYKLKGDFKHDESQYYRRFRLQGDQLLLEKKHNKVSCNVVALGLRELHFSLDPSGNVNISITAGGAGSTVTMQSSVCPRNLPKTETP
ncbi:MAG: prepilin-type N-terminal cleavage/methylation domain-containing protein [Firmicutes bacterium]|nr:prepilin-type N-terminal cleavage/methylation domain-containing protein [Bacillota bacterium]